MGHDESQARQAALAKFVRLMKASANDMVSEVEAISYTGDITQLTNYELTVVIGQLQAQLFSNLNPHRPSGIAASEPEPTPATPTPAAPTPAAPTPATPAEPTPLAAWKTRMQQITRYGGASNQPTPTLAPPTPAPEPEPEPERKRLSLYSLFQEVGQDYDKLYDALKAYNKPELVRSARSYKLAGKSALLKYSTTQLIEELVTFVKNQRESWGTPTPDWEPAPAPAPAPAPEPAPEPGLSWLDNPEAFTL